MPGRFAAKARRIAAACTWTRSAISDTLRRPSVNAAPSRPGSRWWSAPIPLNRCVTRVAPASVAAVACASVAVEWPSDVTTPLARNAPIASTARSASGPSVVRVTTSGSAAIQSRSGGTMSSRRCAPGAPPRNGPSRCAPAICARPGGRCCAPAISARREAYESSGAVTSVGHHVVVPCPASKSSRRSQSAPDAWATSTSSIPLTWMSTKPADEQAIGNRAPRRRDVDDQAGALVDVDDGAFEDAVRCDDLRRCDRGHGAVRPRCGLRAPERGRPCRAGSSPTRGGGRPR